MKELALRGHDVTIVTVEGMSQDRKIQGWIVPDISPASVIIAPSKRELCAVLEGCPPHSVHIVAGIRTSRLGLYIARKCIRRKLRVGILTEAPDPRGIGGVLRKLKYSFEHLLIGTKYGFVLAMGEQGVSWFRGCGYPAHKLYPFCYVTEPAVPTNAIGQNDNIRLVFVGRLVELKGVDLLLQAIANIQDVELIIIGDGPELASLRKVAEKMKQTDRVAFIGQVSNEKAMDYVASSDLLIIPSRKDGWAAVVNESLMRGTPVICSNACGAADLLQEPFLGSVVESENVEELSTAISEWTNRIRSGQVSKSRILQWAECIAPDAVARYFEQIMQHLYSNHSRPKAPWRR